MRRGLGICLLALLAPLLGTPAEAGDNTYVVVRAVDELALIGQTCAGEDADPPETRIGLSRSRVVGHGSLALTTAADAVGGLLVSQPRPLRGVRYWASTPAGGAPQGRWHVEVNDDVLTSDPIDLQAGRWDRYDLADATLTDGDGWTGSIEEYIAEFGKGHRWSVGLLTGGCLGSPEVRLDAIGTRRAQYDFEARVWLTIEAEGGTVSARAWKYDARNNRTEPVSDARVTLLRRGPQDGHFHPAHTARTDDRGRVSLRVNASRETSWRATWQRRPQNVPSDVVLQTR